MDIFGGVVNIIHLTRRVVELVEGAKDANEDRARLVNAVFSAGGVITTFQSLAKTTSNKSLLIQINELCAPSGLIPQYEALLEKILQKIVQVNAHKSELLNKVDASLRTIKWTWDKKYVEGVIREVENIQSSLNHVVSSVPTGSCWILTRHSCGMYRFSLARRCWITPIE